MKDLQQGVITQVTCFLNAIPYAQIQPGPKRDDQQLRNRRSSVVPRPRPLKGRRRRNHRSLIGPSANKVQSNRQAIRVESTRQAGRRMTDGIYRVRERQSAPALSIGVLLAIDNLRRILAYRESRRRHGR